ncbi:unnamed protein product [Haemonchus placei]|uniref:Rab3 GTPase-activating protein catalytic subunit n=1 Tax=Haemonchus placei TaxID=6290 RepID=A0A0N4WKK2_HAEPC|nr:unnamed protein product [Haemonchus placei]
MASEEFSLDIASTSEGSTADVVLDKAMKILECLVIDWKSKRSLESDSGNLSKTNRTLKDAKEMECRQPIWKRQNKWTPYLVPRKHQTIPFIDDLYSVLSQIRFPEDVDVDVLRLCLLDRRDIPVACSVQAVRRPPTPDGEVDELSEYFAHFVRVDLKMSSLAESMYV